MVKAKAYWDSTSCHQSDREQLNSHIWSLIWANILKLTPFYNVGLLKRQMGALRTKTTHSGHTDIQRKETQGQVSVYRGVSGAHL